MEFKIPMKLCDSCNMITYSIVSSLSNKTLYYCQNCFCIKYGRSQEK